ncbi:MAG: hypothetical protein AAFP13_04035 [Pseudomonadota bacterium]
MDPQDASDRLAMLRAAIATNYGIGGDLGRQLRKIRRTLPRYEVRQAEALVRVEAALGNSHEPAEIDTAAFERAETALYMHLEGLSDAERRGRVALDIATTVIVNLSLAALVLGGLWAWVA